MRVFEDDIGEGENWSERKNPEKAIWHKGNQTFWLVWILEAKSYIG